MLHSLWVTRKEGVAASQENVGIEPFMHWSWGSVNSLHYSLSHTCLIDTWNTKCCYDCQDKIDLF